MSTNHDLLDVTDSERRFPSAVRRPASRRRNSLLDRLGRYLACIRLTEILVLQGPPFFGAAFALRNPGLEEAGLLAILTIANLLLMAHVFMINDWSGHTTDLADPNKTAGVFTNRGVERREIGWFAAGLFALSIVFFAALGSAALIIAIAIAALSALYSLPRFHWKSRPLVSSATHLAGGILHVLLGYSLRSSIDGRGVAIAIFFALMFVAGHLLQEVRDHEGDSMNGIRTNAVIFGPRRTFLAGLVVFLSAYALLVILALQGIVPRLLASLAVIIPIQTWWSIATLRRGLSYANVASLQVYVRLLYALIGAVMVASLLC